MYITRSATENPTVTRTFEAGMNKRSDRSRTRCLFENPKMLRRQFISIYATLLERQKVARILISDRSFRKGMDP